jgi:hypothetical protein
MRILRLCLGLAISMPLVVPALAELAITGAPVTMRAGPTGRAAVVQRIPQSAKIELETCDRNWCRVSWRGRSGYVPANAVVVGSPLTALSRDKMPPPAVNAPTDAARSAWRWTGPYFGVNGGLGLNSWQR